MLGCPPPAYLAASAWRLLVAKPAFLTALATLGRLPGGLCTSLPTSPALECPCPGGAWPTCPGTLPRVGSLEAPLRGFPVPAGAWYHNLQPGLCEDVLAALLQAPWRRRCGAARWPSSIPSSSTPSSRPPSRASSAASLCWWRLTRQVRVQKLLARPSLISTLYGLQEGERWCS